MVSGDEQCASGVVDVMRCICNCPHASLQLCLLLFRIHPADHGAPVCAQHAHGEERHHPRGDQNYLVMATDRRYSHYVGRPLNRFEPDKAKLKMTDQFAPINEEILKDSLSNPRRQMKLMASALAKTVKPKSEAPRGPTKKELQEQAEKAKKDEALRQHRHERRLIHDEMEKAKGLPLSKSLVRMAFKDPLPSLASLAYLDD